MQILFAVQNGSLHQKETVHDNDFEPYLSGQSTQVNPVSLFHGIIEKLINNTWPTDVMVLICLHFDELYKTLNCSTLGVILEFVEK